MPSWLDISLTSGIHRYPPKKTQTNVSIAGICVSHKHLYQVSVTQEEKDITNSPGWDAFIPSKQENPVDSLHVSICLNGILAHFFFKKHSFLKLKSLTTTTEAITTVTHFDWRYECLKKYNNNKASAYH